MIFFQKKTRLFGLLFVFACLFAGGSCGNPPFYQGEILYVNFCVNCHMEDGKGLKGVIPPLVGADYIKNNPVGIACAIRKGLEGEIVVNDTTYNQPMAAIPQLNDVEITNIINYICQAWGNNYGVVKLEEVKQALQNCQ